jgi:hypothetical protein
MCIETKNGQTCSGLTLSASPTVMLCSRRTIFCPGFTKAESGVPSKIAFNCSAIGGLYAYRRSTPMSFKSI